MPQSGSLAFDRGDAAMILSVAFACAGLLAATADERTSYEAATREAGRDPAAHVRLALWCEAHDLTAERARHLALAVLADPANAMARGLLGQVADSGLWRRPEAIAGAAGADAELAAALAEYNARRERTPETAAAQWKLAVWCREHGLKPEETAHLTAVVRLDPGRELARARLGYKKHRGRWMTDEQVATLAAAHDAQREADRKWGPDLLEWKTWLGGRPDKRAEAEARLAALADPLAVPAVWRHFAVGKGEDQPRAVRLLGQITGQAASRALAALAVFGKTEAVREAATGALLPRDPREFVDPLVDLLRTPSRAEVRPADGPGSAGTLFIEGEWFNLVREYRVDDSRTARAEGTPIGAETFAIPGSGERRRDDEAARKAATRRLRDDLARVERENQALRMRNAPVLRVLRAVGGRDLGEDADAWRAWWTDRQGYAYSSGNASPRPTFTQAVAFSTQPPVVARTRHSCFAAGTLVRTFEGPRPIEGLRVGDRVLGQDTRTGALDFQPVLAVLHNPPNATLRVTIGEEVVVATGIHRFWKAGSGWVAARDLRPGDQVRTLGGFGKVVAIGPGPTQPVFNLEVASHHSFFVGVRGALVHDNSLVEPTPAPFDAVAVRPH